MRNTTEINAEYNIGVESRAPEVKRIGKDKHRSKDTI